MATLTIDGSAAIAGGMFMVMFDQQPMGPVPARRPIMMPPDPELEDLMSDPATAEVTLVGPVPMELVEPLQGQERGRSPWRALRWVVAFLLVVPTIFNLVAAANYLLGDDPDAELVRPARLIGAAILLAVLLVAHLLFLRRARRSRPTG
jgi:hypothetical protein